MPATTSRSSRGGLARADASPVSSIDEVIRRLDDIVASAIATRSRIGYFAAMYRNVTLDIKQGIEDHVFENPTLVELLDVTFASRYLSALDHFLNGGTATHCWTYSFEEAGRWGPTVLQQILIACSAHIGLDLGVSVAEVVPAVGLPGFEGDFNRVNAVLVREVAALGKNLAKIWPPLQAINRWFGSEEAWFLNLEVETARKQAWAFALELSPLDPAGRDRRIAEQDQRATVESRSIIHPGFLISLVFGLVRLGELGSIPWKIKALGRRSSPEARAAGPPSTLPPPST